MKLAMKKQIGFLLCGIGVVLMRAFPFFRYEIPLGYDSGLYRSMFLQRAGLESRNMTLLPERIQVMYEPLLGMIGATFMHVLGGRNDRVLTRGRAGLSSLITCISVIFLFAGNKKHTTTILRIVILLIGSFASYQLFWRAYRKQLLGMFFVVSTWYVRTKRRRAAVPLARATLLISKTTRILLLLRGGFVVRETIRTRKCTSLRTFTALRACALLLAFPLLIQMRQSQITGLIAPFFQSINLPDLSAGFQAGGTFLTLQEYCIIARPILILALIGARPLRNQGPKGRFCVTMTGLLTIRVVGQLFFFQRMIGTRDLFLLVPAAYGLTWLRDRSQRTRIVALLLGAIQLLTTGYRISRTFPALIEPQEFAFLREIDKQIPSDAVIIVPGIDYSPRVQGRTQRAVLAPGLFDLNHWGNLDEQWTTQRLDATASAKCSALRADYPALRTRPVFLRQGVNQPKTDLTGSCFTPVEVGPWRTRYRVDIE